MSNPTPKFRYFVRLDANYNPIQGALVKRKEMPKVGKWLDVTECAKLCCKPTTTSSTTTTTTTVATTSTTTTTTTGG